ncbi:phosphoribosylamine--glycine ligase [Spirulina subsalsa FACHB-351]|uniref:Phosphoribosylamine--glycine ligase n=1 Tax=Spirulina subsalsa FACHB-351 TaxID=234711 RepID=A0ABT3L7Q7_9CYAN|nr:phosphoribosylamine--glycine ligase [Spirulina subsalsa]MCW6037536.1 phosphoribosylamine--glycine ligase [Spirulina subsalsa FACHB-351]
MKILVVGNGGREHALVWKLLESPKVSKVICVPGNGGTATLERCQNLPMRVDDFEGIARFANVQGVSLVVVGPEVPLAGGITDFLQSQDLKVFGPTKTGAQIESSKSWAKLFMKKAGIPTAKSKTFIDTAKAREYITQQGAPIVVKADGLAAGKGVVVAETITQAYGAVDALWDQGVRKLVVEEYLTGQEVSVFAVTDGLTYRTLLTAQDHKRIGEGDTGENTGGMGAYSPAPLVTPELMQRIEREVLDPTLAEFQRQKITYCGVLYAGLMISPQGDIKVLEFNCRFGDPETQAILPLLETPLHQILLACVEQKLADFPPIEWKEKQSVCVVAASGGYPGGFQKGKEISGLDLEAEDVFIFHAGTKQKGKGFVTDGGRVLGVTALAEDFDRAIAKAYNAIHQIEFEGIYYRPDIAYRVKSKPPQVTPPPLVAPTEQDSTKEDSIEEDSIEEDSMIPEILPSPPSPSPASETPSVPEASTPPNPQQPPSNSV